MMRGRLLHLRWGCLLHLRRWRLMLRWWWQLLLRWLRRLRWRLRWRRWRFGHHLRRRWRWGLHRLRDWRRHDRWCGPYKLMLRSCRHRRRRRGAHERRADRRAVQSYKVECDEYRNSAGAVSRVNAADQPWLFAGTIIYPALSAGGALRKRAVSACHSTIGRRSLGVDHQGRDHRAWTAWVGAAAWQLTLPTSPIPGAALRMSYRSSCLCPVISRRHRPIQLNGALIQDSPATWAVYGIKSARV